MFDDLRGALREAWTQFSIRAGIDDWHHSKFSREQAEAHYNAQHHVVRTVRDERAGDFRTLGTARDHQAMLDVQPRPLKVDELPMKPWREEPRQEIRRTRSLRM